jgi:hypothetical protein
VIRLRLPPLRERSEDIPLLTRHFLQKSARELGVEPKRMSDEALAYLTSLPFPGNVRQLENLANWLTVMAPAQTVEIKDLPPDLVPSGAPVTAAVDGADAPAALGGGDVSRVQPSVGAATLASAPVAAASNGAPAGYPMWESGLRTEVARLLRENSADVMDELARRFEAAVIREALDFTRAAARSRRPSGSASAATPSRARSRNCIWSRSRRRGMRAPRMPRSDIIAVCRHAHARHVRFLRWPAGADPFRFPRSARQQARPHVGRRAERAHACCAA